MPTAEYLCFCFPTARNSAGQKVKDYLMNEIQPQNLTSNQKDELEKRLKEHNENRNSGSDAFEFLDTLKSKYEL